MNVFRLLLLVTAASTTIAVRANETIWATADSLTPAWGFFPINADYGGTKPTGKSAAWTVRDTTAVLTWVAEFPATGVYHVWVRHYGGYGNVSVAIDEQPVTGGRGGPGGGRYVWKHLGATQVTQGRHHADITVTRTMFDAVVFTRDGALQPAKGPLPEPVKQPCVRALRTYRDDSPWRTAAGERGFVVGTALREEEVLYDWLPRTTETMERLRLWGAANQFVAGTFAVRALEAAEEFVVSLSPLMGPGKATLSEVDLRVVHVRERKATIFHQPSIMMLVPELLLRDDRTALPPTGDQGGFGSSRCMTHIPAHQSRQFWVTVRVPPATPPGIYSGSLLLAVAGAATRRLALPVELEVLPIELQPAEGRYGIYYPSQPTKTDRRNYVSPQRYRAELEDMVCHGLNFVTLYGGFETLRYAREAGMTKAPCLMHWPSGKAGEEIAQARKMGFDGLLYYGVDEPRGTEKIERCRKEAERRRRLGLPMMAAINDRTAQKALQELVDYPVYVAYVFHGKDNPAARAARERGFHPVSYWTTITPFPLHYRALTGLYNHACGYLGAAPWAYQDFPDNRLYDGAKPAHAVAYPDANGRPIPTRCWEAMRDGIDDVRYLEALDRAIQRAAKRPDAVALARARAARQTHYEKIGGRYFDYLCGLQPGALDATRRALADAIVALRSSGVE